MKNHCMIEIFMVMKVEVIISWVVTLFSDVVGYQCFRGSVCFHLRGWYSAT